MYPLDPGECPSAHRLQGRGCGGGTSLGNLGFLVQTEGKRTIEVLLASRPLLFARILSDLLEVGFLEAAPRVTPLPGHLLVLSIYGPGAGVAHVDEPLYASGHGPTATGSA
jgi:hypothetical protein